MPKQYWLMKSEPTTFSVADLAANGTTYWSGVRNFQARNFMRDQMRVQTLKTNCPCSPLRCGREPGARNRPLRAAA